MLPIRKRRTFTLIFFAYFVCEENTDQKNFKYGHFSHSVMFGGGLIKPLHTAEKMKVFLKRFFL